MSIKLRVALVFAAALAVAFALGSWLFVTQLASQLRASTDKALSLELSAASQYVPAGRTLRPPGNDVYLIQVIDPTGRVRNESPETRGAPLVSPAVLRRARNHRVILDTTLDGDQTRLLAGPLRGHKGWVGVAGTSLESEDDTVGTAVTGLIIGGCVFVVLGGIGAYWLAAAALSPVERMRREVGALSETGAASGVQVPHTRDELAALAGTMNGLLGRLHGALARQRGFVADASHELRTPLAVLGAELELARKPGRSRDELAEAVANADDEVARLTRITNDLLVLARSDEGRLAVRPVRADIAALLSRSAAAAGRRAASAGVTLVVEAPDELSAEFDEDRIRQAVDNLVDNALRFAPRGSTVTLAAHAAESSLEIEVADGGPGFPAEYLLHAFERFNRPDTDRARSGGGAGLGLAIVAAIAAAHGGTARASNVTPTGAVVRMDLPVAVPGDAVRR
jgi:two-component system, OmpR family, sensor kinase